jgi:hypothetical protein
MSASPRKSSQNLTLMIKSETTIILSTIGLFLLSPHIAGRTHPVCAECPNKVRIAEARCVVPIAFCFFLCAGFEIGRGDVTPRRLRVYANRANIIDFSEADDVQPSLNISLLEGETSVTEYPLRMAAFASINSLSLFFVRNLQTILQTYSRSESCSNESVCRVTQQVERVLEYTTSDSREKRELYERKGSTSSRYLQRMLLTHLLLIEYKRRVLPSSQPPNRKKKSPPNVSQNTYNTVAVIPHGGPRM